VRRRRVGRVGRPHGLDGTFHVEDAEHPLQPGTVVRLAGLDRAVDRRAGTRERPLVRVEGISDRDAAAELRGEALTVSVDDAPLEEGEWLAEDLVGCRIDGLGRVRRVIRAPSCDLLEAGPHGTLVPFVRDAIRAIDVSRRVIEVDRRFLALDAEQAERGATEPGRPPSDGVVEGAEAGSEVTPDAPRTVAAAVPSAGARPSPRHPARRHDG
jgi:16S rRNA processing protein RimM